MALQRPPPARYTPRVIHTPTPTTIALVTAEKYASLPDDDRLLIPALERLGARATPVVWSDPTVRWESFDAIVVRSCWDYHLRAAEFIAWVDRVEALGVPVANPPSVLRWNADKRYLRELEGRGVRTVPTLWIESGEGEPLPELLRSAGWDHAVVKPVVSASAHDTWRTSRARAAADEPRFAESRARGALMVQRFMPEIESAGEWSLVYLAGAFSHAVVKRPASGDFRVQKEHGGSSESVEPGAHLVDAGLRAIAAAPAALTYARVDGCEVEGELVLMELEALEPSLFLDHEERAPERFAEAIARLPRRSRTLADR